MFGASGADYLVINRGSQLIADGTPTEPITFTSQSDLDNTVDEETAAGRTAVFVAVDGAPAGVLSVADTLRPTARKTIARLRELGIEPVMITGDNRRTAEAVATDLGLKLHDSWSHATLQ